MLVTRADELDALAERVEKLTGPGEPCAVKPLEWKARSSDALTFDANTPIGHFVAGLTEDDCGMWFLVGQTTSNRVIGGVEAAKAAAQADYEKRIRSALVATPQPVAGWNERAWLIEWPLSPVLPARWWHSEAGWVHDANKAMRFCRQEDAEAFIRANVFCAGMRATEHVFVGNPVRREAPVPAEGVEKARWEVGKNGWDASNEITREDI